MDEQAEPLLRERERRALASAASAFAEMKRDFIRFVICLLPALLRVACVTLCTLGVVYGTLDAWQVFGSDGAALIPAVVLGIIPLMFAFISRVKWGGMVAAGAFTYFAAKILLLIPFPFNQVFLVVVLAALIFSDMARRSNETEQQTNEQQ